VTTSKPWQTKYPKWSIIRNRTKCEPWWSFLNQLKRSCRKTRPDVIWLPMTWIESHVAIAMYDMTNTMYTYRYIMLGCASSLGILVLFLVLSLQVLYLTILLAQSAEHRGLLTNNYWSISGNEAVFTLCIDEWWVSMDTDNINDITWRTQLWNVAMTIEFRSVAVKL